MPPSDHSSGLSFRSRIGDLLNFFRDPIPPTQRLTIARKRINRLSVNCLNMLDGSRHSHCARLLYQTVPLPLIRFRLLAATNSPLLDPLDAGRTREDRMIKKLAETTT
jgi:hypothetical protein